MHPYTTTPHSRDRRSTLLCLIAAILTLAAFYGSSLVPAYGSLIQLAGLVCLTAAVYIMVRNRTPITYAVEQDANGTDWDLTITRTKGKLRITECRLCMRDIREIDIANSQNLTTIRQKYQNDTVYHYCPTLFPETSLYLRFEDSAPENPTPRAIADEAFRPATGRVVIRIANDPTILSMLQQSLNS